MFGSRNHIVLIGFMGSGKTTVGALLANALELPFIDLDALIVEKEGMSISSIFAEKGEPYFRKIEHKLLLQSLTKNRPSVISTGGGAPCFHNGINLINEYGLSFYLKIGRQAILDRIMGDSERPLVIGKTKVQLMKFIDGSLRTREAYYQRADRVVRAFRTPEKIVDRILNQTDKFKK